VLIAISASRTSINLLYTLLYFYVISTCPPSVHARAGPRSDSAEGRVRFQHRQDSDYAFERSLKRRLGTPDYPYAPDSNRATGACDGRSLRRSKSNVTVFLEGLGPRLASATWQARPAFDFAQGITKVLVYYKYCGNTSA